MSKKSKNSVTAYAESVLSGKTVAGRWVKMAAERHIRDLKRRDIWFDTEAAARVYRFFSTVLRLNGGQFEGNPFELRSFQQFILGSLFGWKRKSDGFRRFRSAYIETAKGSGKSPLGAGCGIYMLSADHEPRAECYAAAATKDQAMVSFRDAVAMRNQSPALLRRLTTSGTAENVWNLAHIDSGSWFRPISREKKGKSGQRPHFALCDELHEHPDGYVLEMLEAGFKGRRQPLLMEITNSGSDLLSVCGRRHTGAIQILKGIVEDDSRFCIIFALDSCDKCYAEGYDQPKEGCETCDRWDVEGEHWRKPNPNLGVTIDFPYLRDLVNKAKIEPERENTVKRLNFGLWTQQVTRFVPMDAWHACAGTVDPVKLQGRVAYPGLDFSNKIDLSAMCLVFPPEQIPVEVVKAEVAEADKAVQDGNQPAIRIALEKLVGEFELLPFVWIPEENIAERSKRDGVPYELWAKQGHIELTPGSVIDYDYILDRFEELSKLYKFPEFAYDPWNATQFALAANKRTGVTPVEVRQVFGQMSEPTKEFLRLVLAKKIKHAKHPVLTWCADNLMVQRDRKGNVQPAKNNPNKKIDAIVAAIIGLSRAIVNGSAHAESVYERRGVRTL